MLGPTQEQPDQQAGEQDVAERSRPADAPVLVDDLRYESALTGGPRQAAQSAEENSEAPRLQSPVTRMGASAVCVAIDVPPFLIVAGTRRAQRAYATRS